MAPRGAVGELRDGTHLGDLVVVSTPEPVSRGVGSRFWATRGVERLRVRCYPLGTLSLSSTAVPAELQHRHDEVRARLAANRAGGQHVRPPTELDAIGSLVLRITPDPEAVPISLLPVTGPTGWYLLVRSLLFGLHALHRSGVVHGDLCTERLFVRPVGDGRHTVVLVDLDEARPAGAPFPSEPSAAVSPWWSPELTRATGGPEQVPAEPASDVFSLGLLLHHLASGAWPTVGGRVAAAPAADVLAGRDLRLPGTSGDVAALLGSMIDVEPARRPTLEEVIVAVRGLGEAPWGSWTHVSPSAVPAPSAAPAPADELAVAAEDPGASRLRVSPKAGSLRGTLGRSKEIDPGGRS